jgi:hypothetical protein
MVQRKFDIPTVRHRRNERFPLLWTVQSRTPLELCNESIERPHNVAFTDEVNGIGVTVITLFDSGPFFSL